jgi:ketosteroid isomerase-like protein
MRPLLLAAALALAGCADTGPRVSMMEPAASLAAAETAFAAHSVREDMRAAFLANFADDGVFVRNGWMNSNQYLRDQKAPPIVLDWRPQYVEAASSGELGLSTGPSKITSKAKPDTPPSYGQFVSVWRREPGKPWKVVVDLGISHPQSRLWDAGLETRVVQGGPAKKAGIGEAELEFALDAQANGLKHAYGKMGSPSMRFYRGGMQPAVGKIEAMDSPGMKDEKLIWTIDHLETARSNDFGYSRGSYAAASDPGKPLGWYLRVWRSERGEWRILMDVTNAAPRS